MKDGFNCFCCCCSHLLGPKMSQIFVRSHNLQHNTTNESDKISCMTGIKHSHKDFTGAKPYQCYAWNFPEGSLGFSPQPLTVLGNQQVFLRAPANLKKLEVSFRKAAGTLMPGDRRLLLEILVLAKRKRDYDWLVKTDKERPCLEAKLLIKFLSWGVGKKPYYCKTFII